LRHVTEFAFTLKSGARVTATAVRVLVAGEALDLRGEDVERIELITDGRAAHPAAPGDQ
jgi:hypothetical protein